MDFANCLVKILDDIGVDNKLYNHGRVYNDKWSDMYVVRIARRKAVS